MLRSSDGQAPTPHPCALAGAVGPGDLRGRCLRGGRQHAAERRLDVRRKHPLADRDVDEGHHVATPKKRRRVYIVKSGDTLSAIADKTGVSLATIQRLNPKLDADTLHAGQHVRLRGDGRASASSAAAVLAAAVAARPRAPGAARRAAPPAIRAPAAILVEPATGDVVYQRNATRPRADRVDDEADDGLLTLENAKLVTDHARGALPRAAGRVGHRAARRRAPDRRRPAARRAARQRQRRRGHAGGAHRRLAEGLRAR